MYHFLLKNKFLLLLFVIGIATHLLWFDPQSVLAYSDWKYWSGESISQLWYSWGTWISFWNFGSVNIQIPFLLFNSLWSLIVFLSPIESLASKLTFFIPISLLGFTSPYFLIKKVLHNKFASFVGSLMFGTSSYFIMLQTSHITLAFVYAISPLFYYTFLKALEKNNWKQWILFLILYFIGIAYEIRIMYIVSLSLLFLAIFYLKEIKGNISKIVIIGFLSLLINLFWLAPILQGNLSSNINYVANRGLFGSDFFSMFYAITLYHPFWAGTTQIPFVPQIIPSYFWIIPILSFLGLYVNPKKKLILYFGLITLAGILLAKQADLPLQHLYIWLYENFPGFNLFREASKFYILIALGYSVLVASLFSWLLEKYDNKVNINSLNFYSAIQIKWKYYLTTFLSFLMFTIYLINSVPFFTGEVRTLFVSRQIPTDYINLKNFLLEQKTYFKTLWTPTSPQWSVHTNEHPKVSNVSLIGDKWKHFVKDTETSYSELDKIKKIISVLKQPYSNILLDFSSIKYVIIPFEDKKNDDNFYSFYGLSQDLYIRELDKLDYLEKIDIGTEEVVVYENKDYKPYIFSLNKLYEFETLNNLESKYELIDKKLNSEFAFTKQDNDQLNRVSETTKIFEVFENLNPTNINSNNLSTEYKGLHTVNNKVFTDFGRQSTYIDLVSDSSEIVLEKKIDSSLVKEIIPTSTSEIFRLPISTEDNYVYQVASSTFKIFNTNSLPLRLGIVEQPVVIHKIRNNNLIPNGHFENDLWSEVVGDCNAYDSNPILDMSLKNNDENNYLQLSATRHIACTNTQNQPISPGSYLLEFDYKSSNAKHAGYYLGFSGSNPIAQTEKLPIKNINWQHFKKLISVPQGIGEFNLYVYSYATDGKTNIITNYDNFSLRKLEHVATIDPEYEPDFQSVPLPAESEIEFTFSEPGVTLENIIPNPDLEEGLWSETVGDCNAYDDNGILDISLRQAIAEEDAVDNPDGFDNQLELQATRHIACTGPGILPIKENKQYLLSFKYQSDNAKNAGYYVGFNGVEGKNLSERLPIIDQEWQEFNKIIDIPQGATSASLVVYSYSQDEKTNIITRYDDFSLIELPDIDNRFYLVSEPERELVNPEAIEFDLINPTKKQVHVKGATTPFFLAMSESFHPQWQAQFNNEKINGFLQSWIPWVSPDRIPDEEHFELNGFLNGWYIDVDEYCREQDLCTQNADGSYDIELTIEFFPQRWFYFGLLISGTTLLGCLSYLGYDFVRRRKQRKRENVKNQGLK